MSTTTKLRILCLHGFSSNGPVHAHQVRSLTNHPLLASKFEFLFPSGPHPVDVIRSLGDNASTIAWSTYVAQHSGTGHRAWWFAKDPDPFTGRRGEFGGLEKSLDMLGELMRKEGEIHAIWGFSQGACFAGMLMGLLSDANKNHPLRRKLPETQGMPKAGVFFSGFKARFEQYDGIYGVGGRIETPTLHVLGERDVVVSEERSEELMLVCGKGGRVVLRHAGGHDIPGKEEDQEVIVRFLLDNMREKRGSL